MKRCSFLFFVIILLSTSVGFAQNNRNSLPENLKEAITFLNTDCPDSLKTLIKTTEDENLKKLVYPWGGKYMTLFNWNSSENPEPKLIRHLHKKGINNFIETVILVAFKQSLLGQMPHEDEIIKPYLEIENRWSKEDAIRATTDTLRGIYIPKDMEDCFLQINSYWSDSTKKQVKQWNENEFTAKVHLGFGMWLRNNWQLWQGSRLSAYFNSMGVNHPESISAIILTSYHRKLTGKAIMLEEQVKSEKEFWKQAKEKEEVTKKNEYLTFKIGDTVLFKYNYGYSTPEQENSHDNDSCQAKGLILDKNEKNFKLKIKVLESCDNMGIIYYDNKNTQSYNIKTKKWKKPNKRIINLIKIGKEYWSNYEDWEVNY